MVNRDTPWPDGTPCWVDLMTTDATAARQFYGGMFGWDISVGGEETGYYGMATLGGRNVAGIGQMAGGNPPAWTTYLAIGDADATAAAITTAGGTVLQQPFDVLDVGRMLVAGDPTGAVFGVWQAKSHNGFQIANESNAVTWNEVLTRDRKAAEEFYAAVFGYTYTSFGEGYSMFEVNGNTAGGIGEFPADAPPEAPSHWRAYFAVDDADAAVARVVELGGSVVRQPQDMPYGRHADVSDPQGAYFAVIAPAPAA